MLSHFDCMYSGYITQGCAGGALVGCYEPTCQVLLFPYTHERKIEGIILKSIPVLCHGSENFRLQPE